VNFGLFSGDLGF